MTVELDEDERSMLSEVGRRHGLWTKAEPTILARGTENTTYTVGEFIVRRSDDRAAVAREVALLTALAATTTTPVPVPVAHAPELGLFAYRRLLGTPLIHRIQRQSAVIEPALVAVLGALRRLEPVLQLPVDDYANEEWHQEAVQGFLSIRSHLDAEQADLVAAFLDEPPPPTRSDAVAQHNDLGAEHILVGPHGGVTGIIDWTDAARTDPARDIGAIYRDLGSGIAFRVSQALGRPVTDDEARRIRFHARCKWLEDVRFGLQDPAARGVYLSNAQRTFDHTFGPSR